MPKTATTVKKRPVIRVPQNIEELNEFVRLIGERQRRRDEINRELNERVEALKAEATEKIKPLADEETALFDGVYAFANSRRDELTDHDKKKTINLPAGDISWRLSPKAAKIKNVKAVLAALKKLGLTRFIRSKEEIDKEQMLKEETVAQSVEGVKIKQEELFSVKPASVSAEITRDSLRKAKPETPTNGVEHQQT